MSHFVNYLRNGSFYLLFLKIMVEKCKLINIIRINLKFKPKANRKLKLSKGRIQK